MKNKKSYRPFMQFPKIDAYIAKGTAAYIRKKINN